MSVGIEPRFEEWTGPLGTEVAFVLSANLHRRHLDESQRAAVANEVATMERGRPENSSIELITQDNAAEMLNVSVASVKRARTVKENGVPELYDAVRNGKIAVSQAAKLVKEDADAVHPFAFAGRPRGFE